MPVQQITFLTTALTSLPSYAPGKFYNPATNTWITPGTGGEIEDMLTVINFPPLASKQTDSPVYSINLTTNSPAPLTLVSGSPSIATVGAGSSVNNGNNYTWTFLITVIGNVGITTLTAFQDDITGFAQPVSASERVLTVDPITSAEDSFVNDIQNFYGDVSHTPPHIFTISGEEYDFGYATLVGTLPANQAGHVRFEATHTGPIILGFSLQAATSEATAKQGFQIGYDYNGDIAVTDPASELMAVGSYSVPLKFKVERDNAMLLKGYISTDGTNWQYKHTFGEEDAALKIICFSGGGTIQNVILNIQAPQ